MTPDAPLSHAFGAFSVYAPAALPNLPPAGPAGDPDSRIDLDWATCTAPDGITWDHHWVDGDDILLSMARQGSSYWLRVPHYADFLVQQRPCRVLVSPTAQSLDAATLEHLLVDQILPRVLAQLGGTLVHASTVRIGPRHVLFLGPSGWGKSTLAGLLHQRGHHILSDDCVQLVAEAGRFRAVPTYPSLRLNADSLEALFPDQVEAAPVASYSNKRRIPMEATRSDAPAFVDAIYLLGDPDQAGQEVKVGPVPPSGTCLSLIKHSFRLDLADHSASALQLQQCSSIARTVPGFRLDYPRDHARHDALISALVAHVATLSVPEEAPDPP